MELIARKGGDVIDVNAMDVTTLALGLWLRQGLAKVQAKSEAQESNLMLSGV